ncbi:MAG: type III-B CRISPR-associated protein Cas10/Cmr2 [Porphyromonadaceae bacterium]|nr:type III-B CRISPR-associated protein Cas10/Cmr2 [Porphyromonadaceae bacterium]
MEGCNRKGKVYTAITIGPIGKTLGKARKVKAYWSASYMFSWIMRELLSRISKIEGLEIFSPAYDSTSSEALPSGVGLFPDRAFIRGEGLSDQILEDMKSDTLDLLAFKLHDSFWKNNPDAATDDIPSLEELRLYLEDYIMIASVTIESNKEKGIISKLNQYLDTLELRQRATSSTNDYLTPFLAQNNSFIEQEIGKGTPFVTTSRIAVSGWLDDAQIKTCSDEEGSIDYAEVRKNEVLQKSYRNCYKYLAVVKADGDSFGKFIAELGDKEMQAFSQAFFDFSVQVAGDIASPRTVPVYIGGDDLFFFVPIYSPERDEDIFSVISSVEACFGRFKAAVEGAEGLSLSYGVSIFYYKSPMSEAIEVANQLLGQAKSSGRDRVAVSIRKHSGRTIEFTLPCKESTHSAPVQEEEQGEQEKSPKLYAKTLELMRSLSKDEEVMIEGLIYWLDEMLDMVVVPILQIQDQELRKKRLQALRENFFDEDIHSDYDGFLTQVFAFMYAFSLEHGVGTAEEISEFKKLIYGLLRYCQFITDTEER